MSDQTKWCDLVLEGGGVKGIGLVGAIEVLSRAGYTVRRVAGTSAGAIVGSLAAAGMPADKLTETMHSLDYTKFKDKGFLAQFGAVGEAASIALTKGIYKGDYLQTWLAGQLEALGVRTFADLALTEPWAKHLPPEQRYKLVVVVSDVSQGRMLRLPWDYAKYGLDPNKQPVAEAVRGSMSIPFFYQPSRLRDSYLVDGGLLSNFPIDLFDTTNDWPTFGIKLSAKPRAGTAPNSTSNIVNYSLAILSTTTNAHDQMHIDDPCTQRRTIFIDTDNISSTDFAITPAQQQFLYQSGQTAVTKFLKTWDFADYKKTC
ncbi:MAG TPA: patatin-like phospholipase family protein [Patescibacteria group bacterium]|nr:patatin-like phospholipase family protein [Patescibacteria group bacterium]